MKKTLVRTCDYDFYTMRLPFSVIRNRKRSVFVRRELEKRHPQFSEKCCADTKFRIRRGKLTAEVAVMDTLRLAEYRKRFPDRHLFLEGQPERVVFSRRHLRAGRAVAMGVLALCMGMFFGWKTLFRAQPPAALEPPLEAAVAAAILSPEKLFAAILSGIGKNGGRVSSLKWQGGTCTFSVSGCHPEDVSPEIACAVSYANSEPHFELKLPVGHTNALLEGGDTQFLSHLRKALLQQGIVILREELGQKDGSIQMFCRHDLISDALKTCAEQSELHQWHERAIQISSRENGCDIKASFSAGAQFHEVQSPFQVIASYAHEFFPKPRTEKVVTRTHRTEEPAVKRDKIGEIKRINGEVFAYYRLHDGRIVCERAQ